jgi:hypothetical protein
LRRTALGVISAYLVDQRSVGGFGDAAGLVELGLGFVFPAY